MNSTKKSTRIKHEITVLQELKTEVHTTLIPKNMEMKLLDDIDKTIEKNNTKRHFKQKRTRHSKRR